MSCIYPIKIKNPNYNGKDFGTSWRKEKFYFVPCGKCIQCQIAKRTWLSNACEYEHNKYGTGCFVTFTYDNNNLPIEESKPTLRYKDFQDFNKRLRQKLYRKYGERVNYKYVAVGEYGGKFGRPHFHVLFFGLSEKQDYDDIFFSWDKGIIEIDPIKKGGINYVLKYMDKQQNRKKLYEETEEEEPFLKHSIGLGKGLLEENIKDIKNNGGLYLGKNFKRYPIPSYWARKLCIEKKRDFTKVKLEMKQRTLRPKNEFDYTEKEVKEYLFRKSIYNEKLMIKQARAEQNGAYDIDKLDVEIKVKEMGLENIIV